MTHEEAKRLVRKALNSWPNEVEGGWVEIFVALGMLKLDEPKSAPDVFFAKMKSKGYPWGTQYKADFITALEEVGLKIVEK